MARAAQIIYKEKEMEVNSSTIVGQIVLGLLIAYFWNKISPYISKIEGTVRVALINILPALVRGMFRKTKIKQLRKKKRDRRNFAAVNYQISKTASSFNLFLGVAIVYILLLFLGPLKFILSLNGWLQFLVSAPIYICEVYWLILDFKTKALINEVEKIRFKGARI